MGKAGSKLRPEVLASLTEITNFTEQELQQKYHEFLKYHPSGRMTEEEFVDMYQQIFSKGDAKSFATLTFKSFDRNGDGGVDFKEFICALYITSRGNVKQKLNWAFNLYDIDGNGNVSKDECLNIIRSIHSMMANKSETPEVIVEKIFRTLDKNEDGVISKSEFVEGSSKNPLISSLLNVN
eukprot:sb/3471636/